MKIKNGLFSLILFSLLLIGSIAPSGCANIVPPTGGPKDTIPPRLVSAVPKDSAKNFTGTKIIFNFDEYIDGKDIRNELLVSPVPKIDPIVDTKLRTVTVRIKDTLQDNTTYALFFGKGIKDVNEGNILRNFTYVFSTGAAIDRGDFTGNVVVANTGKADSTLIAVLQDSLYDSAVVKNRPRYIAKCDSAGRFHFRYVKPGTYALYAMKDEGGSHKYLSKAQLFAFADAPVSIGMSTPSETLYAYVEGFDTTKKATTAGGGTGAKPAPPKRLNKESDRRLQVNINASGNVFDVLDTFRITFSSGLKVFDSTQVRFTDENFHDIDARQYRYVRDSTNKTFALYYAWPTDTKYHLIFPRTFGQDSIGRKLLKDDTVSFKTKKDIDYGEIRIRVLNLDMSLHPVLLFVQGDKIKYTIPFNTRREVRRILFPPGEYELRILYDTNRNMIWDHGVFFGKNKRQPEKVTTIRKKLNVKANWDNDQDITL
ncbi:Ig-like domain-containing domain [Puia dinghuensis]|uniref:SbsA Ig-like domain-containing protein n=1 Tax=Puia dinghuensis TaxID=1792502 RepID=A0A8J2UFY4_9BACT|nr:Ig-like domain-containing domain [Puia dinghuensis]GGB12445.1 hypothetical protein GCM10011511_40090 [Puia dinghuensis]